MFKVLKRKELLSDVVPYLSVDYSKFRPINLKKSNYDFDINGMRWKSAPHCNYKFNYKEIVGQIQRDEVDAKEAYRFLLRNDLWFLLYFGLGVTVANHPFVVDKCRMVEEGPDTNTLDVWSRDHFKSTIITIGETVQEILRNPEITILILSYTQKLAQSFFSTIQRQLETSIFL
mgnify:FL=1